MMKLLRKAIGAIKSPKPAQTTILRTSEIVLDGITVTVLRKKIKTLRLTVYPPDGEVKLSAPARASEATIKAMIASRKDWILAQQAKILARARVPNYAYVDGERHYFEGCELPLTILPAPYAARPNLARVEIVPRERINLHIHPDSSAEQRQMALAAAYRRHMKARVPDLIAHWEPTMGVQVADWGIKQMRSKWGTCNTQARRIWLNLELMKKPPECLEFVLVHEMVHLLERGHNARFYGWMDRFMPQWRQYQAMLNARPMGMG
ncbi:MAG: M48 family metallopeptidase [Anaerolineae bacterium]|nr:M48 family metallopeptidase [Anaerolineae bacterium]